MTVYGRNLGSLASSRVSCGGAEAASLVRLDDATAPANLYVSHRMQKLSFQVAAAATAGPGQITVTVNGRTSNPLPFTVRSGRVLFAKATGSDATGDGSWAKPWRSIPAAVAAMVPGDVTYVGDGVDQTEVTDFDAAVVLGASGGSGQPKALLVEPGARSRVGNPAIRRAFLAYDGERDEPSTGWVLAGFTVTTAEVGLQAYALSRLVGNFVTAPQGDGADGAIGVWGSDVAVLGNELTAVGSSQSGKLYHAVYLNGTRRGTPPRPPAERHREVGWNHLHDNLSNRAINVYTEEAYSAFLEGHDLHDNVIVNQHGDGILLGDGVTGDNRIANNLVVRGGLGPEWPDDASSHAGIRVDTGHDAVTGTVVRVAHNTLYACGAPDAAFPEESGSLYVSPRALARSDVLVLNNVVVSTGEAYLASASGAIPPGVGRNLFSGAGAPPAWDTQPIAASPGFVNPAANDFQLGPSSPALDAAVALSPPVVRDLLGVPRPQGSASDVGAYERVVTGTPACAPSATALCIDGRFQVEIDWSTGQGGGGGGKATAIPTAPVGVTAGGLFWFFGASNPEVLVKVLNGCAVNGHHWVFASAGTNVGLTIRVTDTSSGEARSYSNPDSNPAAPVQDVTAFATCP